MRILGPPYMPAKMPFEVFVVIKFTLSVVMVTYVLLLLYLSLKKTNKQNKTHNIWDLCLVIT